MNPEKVNNNYSQLKPSQQLSDFVDSYWKSENLIDKDLKRIIFPDSFFKVVVIFIGGKIVKYFLTGLWLNEIEIVIPVRASVYGIKFKILASKYILNTEIAPLLNSQKELPRDFWDIGDFQIEGLNSFKKKMELVIIEKLLHKQVSDKELKLSQLLYPKKGNILVKEVSNQISWSNRQINRYLNKYLGVSLKTYLNIQKVYAAYTSIRDGEFSPAEGYYDQSHYIREIKKHTGKTPTELYDEVNDRFIQLKHIKKD